MAVSEALDEEKCLIEQLNGISACDGILAVNIVKC
jgi:nitrate reductase NapAB chaperone NapD